MFIKYAKSVLNIYALSIKCMQCICMFVWIYNLNFLSICDVLSESIITIDMYLAQLEWCTRDRDVPVYIGLCWCNVNCLILLPAYLQKTHPGIVMSVKSQHASRRLLSGVKDEVAKLRKDGILDESEAKEIDRVLS